MVASSRWSLRTLSLAVAVASSGLSINASANMGQTPTNYGLLPTDVGSAQALSLFNSQVSATYYNPSYLAKDPRGELTGGILHAEQELRASAADRDGDVLANSPSQQVLIGMKTDLSSLTRLKHPLYLGFVAGVEKFSKEMMAFESTTGVEGQFLNYGRQPLFLNVGGATTLWRGIDVGASARITLQSTASMSVTTDLAGNTQYEALEVSAEPSLRTILGSTVDFGETFCPNSNCWLDGFEAAAAYRTSSYGKTTVAAETIIPGLIPASDPLILAVATYDSFEPSVYSIGAQYSTDRWRVGVTLEQQNWSDLEEKFDRDDIKDQAMAEFDDILIPRIGAEVKLGQHFGVTLGLAYHESPLKSDTTPDVNYFDNDKYIIGLGLSAEYTRTRYLTYPVRLDIGYQHQMLEERDFTLSNTRADGQQSNNIVATTDGDVDIITGSITLKF